jgi:hypothetical protein
MKSVLNSRLKVAIILVVLTSMALAACVQAAKSPRPEEKNAYGGAAPMEMPAAPAPAAMPTSAPMKEAAVTSSQDNAAQAQERIVIKNASLTIVVSDPSESMNNISKMAEAMGGFVVSANMYQQTISGNFAVPRASITIRVPAAKLNQALETIRGESKQKPQNESINSQDVTNEYVDLQSRLKNLEAAEIELTKIMQDANKTEDVLSVYNQLVQIREQIEVIKGQIKYYDQSAALSAITTELIADAAVQPIEIAGWKPVGVAKDAIQALIRAMQGLVNALIWIVIYILPVLLVLFTIFVLPIILIIRAFRRRRAKRKAEAVKIEPAP